MKTMICSLLFVAGLVALPESAQAQLGPYARDRITAPARVYNARVANWSGVATGPYSYDRLTAPARVYNARVRNAAATYGAWGGCVPVVAAPVVYPQPVAYPVVVAPVYPVYPAGRSLSVFVGTGGRRGGTTVGFNAFGL